MKVVAVWENDNYEAGLDCQNNSAIKVRVLPYNRMPEMYTTDGHQLVFAYDIEPIIKDGHISFKPKKTSKFSLVKLPKGSITDYQGKITTPHDTRGPSRETVKNEDYSKKTKQILTLNSFDEKNQDIDMFALLLDVGCTTFLGDLGGFYDLNSTQQDFIKKGIPNPNRVISSIHPALGLIVIVADMEINRMDAEIREISAQIIQKQMDDAKKKGIKEVEAVVKQSQNGNLKSGKKTAFLDKGAFQYGLLEVTDNTITKLMKGDFRSYEDMRSFNDEDKSYNKPNMLLLYKEIGGGDYDPDMYIIETIFYKDI